MPIKLALMTVKYFHMPYPFFTLKKNNNVAYMFLLQKTKFRQHCLPFFYSDQVLIDSTWYVMSLRILFFKQKTRL